MVPTVVVPPVAEARVGTWRVFTDPTTDAYTGDWHAPLMTFQDPFDEGQTIDGTFTTAFPGDPYLYLDGAEDPAVDTPVAILDLPHGFEPDPDYHVVIGVTQGSSPGNVADVCTVNFFAFGDTVTALQTAIPSAEDFVFALTDMDYAKLEALGDTPVIATAAATAQFDGQTSAQASGSHVAYGTYVAFSWWWRVVGTDACGNRFEGPFFQTGVDPGPPWERLDPDDETAHPTPVVLNVTPSHGLLAGGTPFEIHGSGFGVGCAVTFGGVAATSVVAVTESRITGVTPAHAAGLVPIVVTNTDGEHN